MGMFVEVKVNTVLEGKQSKGGKKQKTKQKNCTEKKENKGKKKKD